MLKLIKKSYHRFNAWIDFYPPYALSSEGWDSFKDEFKKKAPIRFWIRNEFPRKFIWRTKHRLSNTFYWIIYRTLDKNHIVNTGLEPGYYDVDERMLNSCFSLLKDYVETELAYRNWRASNEYKVDFFRNYVPLFRFLKPFRSVHHGLEHLTWEAGLDDPSLPINQQSPQQAINAREVRILYLWWTNTRPNRVLIEIKRVVDANGNVIYRRNMNKSSKEYKAYMKSIDDRHKQTEKWIKEDEKMLLRLIKLRKSLWT